MTDTLRCKCGGEVRVVRLGQSLLTLGHVRNPAHQHHAVRLAPASRADRLGERRIASSAEDAPAVGSKGRRDGQPAVSDPGRPASLSDSDLSSRRGGGAAPSTRTPVPSGSHTNGAAAD